MGGAGVTAMLELIRRELDLTMVFCGVRSVAEIDRRVLHQPSR
ncbi:MAG: alpha-hydroxy-acid oxidizing protein [Xanthomonadaceae bacterium]|nr:alpha-hydroxy-acid oxidizing protein [Xanthomonadaceae bacterium]MDE2496818.1 alpha-hydroxy-acid oxidizing protein [Xanthomonadaceae bacterium]